MSRRIEDGWSGFTFDRGRVTYIFLWFLLIYAQPVIAGPTYQQDADLIRHTYEAQLFTFAAKKRGHYGLRMFRQTQNPKYSAAIWADMARIASKLNQIIAEVTTPEQIAAYSARRIERSRHVKSARGQLRYQVTRNAPEYLYISMDVLSKMGRLHEYGLQHIHDKKLREIIRRYDFTHYVTNPEMIRAWAAQLANQVYYLRQLGEQDVVQPFIEAFKATYPDDKDPELSDQQFMNKLYGMTHIVIAASEYYQKSIKESDFQWIFDFYRTHADTILERSKVDVYAEVAINFLLAEQGADPIVERYRKAIQQAINREAGMIPGADGNQNIAKGGHRNVLAIMVLDWRQPKVGPTLTADPEVFRNLPYGLVARQ